MRRLDLLLTAALIAGTISPAPCRAQPPSFQLGDSTLPFASAEHFPASPAPWWTEPVKQPLTKQSAPVGLDLEATVTGVLMFSPQVRIVADVPVIRQTQVADAVSRFDPRAFLDSKLVDTSDPVGNTLTTGGASRYIDQTVITSGGISQTNRYGGQVQLAQRVGYQENNSRFFVPQDQATTRITLDYRHPLLNGAGKSYNTSVIYLAELATQAAGATLQEELQRILLETHRAYWDLHLQRAALLQRMRLKQSAIDIQSELRGRADFDVLQSQIVRADAAVATRDAAVIRYATEVANAETRLRALINDPALSASPHELIPTLTPCRDGTEPNMLEALTTAVQNRPELQRAFTEVRAAGVRSNVSKNQLLPELDLILGAYVYGLNGSSDFGQSWANQFNQGRPTYWTGLQFEYPLYNRGARSQYTQRLVELRQATNRLQQLMIDVRAETEVAVREVTTTYREMLSRYQAMLADQAEIDYLTSRWRLLVGDQQLAGVMLNDLLEAQERLAQAEHDFAAAEAAYNVALVKLNVVTGTLLRTRNVTISDTMINGVPALDVQAPLPTPAYSPPVYTPPVPASPVSPPAPPSVPDVVPPPVPVYIGPSVKKPSLPDQPSQGTLAPSAPRVEPVATASRIQLLPPVARIKVSQPLSERAPMAAPGAASAIDLPKVEAEPTPLPPIADDAAAAGSVP